MSRFRTSKIEEKIAYEIFRSCRLCGAGAGYKMPIVQNVDLDGDVPLTQKIRECVQIEVHQDDKMPPLICELCVDKVNDFYEFSEMCKQTNMKTRLRLGLPPQTMPRGAPNAGDCILGVTETIFSNDDSNEPIIKHKQSKSKKETSDKVKNKSSENNRNSRHLKSPEDNRRTTRRSISSPTNILTLRNRNSKDQKNVDQHMKKSSEPLKSILKKEKIKEEDILVTPKSKRGRERESRSNLPVKRVKIEVHPSTSKLNRRCKSPTRHSTRSPDTDDLVCRVCKRTFHSKGPFTNHIKTHENETKNSKSKRSPPFAEFKSKNRTEKMKPKGKSDSKQNTYSCSCGREYLAKKNLSRHQMTCKLKKKDVIIDPKLMAKVRPLQIRVARCDPLLKKYSSIAELPLVFGLDKNCTYPYLRTVKTEPKTGRDGMVRIEDEIKDVFYEADYIHWDSDTSSDGEDEPYIKKRKVPNLSTLSLKTIFSPRYLGRVRRKRRKVKTEIIPENLTQNKDMFDVVDSFDDVHDLERLNDCSFDQLFGSALQKIVPDVEDNSMEEGSDHKEDSNGDIVSKEGNSDKDVNLSKEEHNSDKEVSQKKEENGIDKENSLNKEENGSDKDESLSKEENSSNKDISNQKQDNNINKEENRNNKQDDRFIEEENSSKKENSSLNEAVNGNNEDESIKDLNAKDNDERELTERLDESNIEGINETNSLSKDTKDISEDKKDQKVISQDNLITNNQIEISNNTNILNSPVKDLNDSNVKSQVGKIEDLPEINSNMETEETIQKTDIENVEKPKDTNNFNQVKHNILCDSDLVNNKSIDPSNEEIVKTDENQIKTKIESILDDTEKPKSPEISKETIISYKEIPTEIKDEELTDFLTNKEDELITENDLLGERNLNYTELSRDSTEFDGKDMNLNENIDKKDINTFNKDTEINNLNIQKDKTEMKADKKDKSENMAEDIMKDILNKVRENTEEYLVNGEKNSEENTLDDQRLMDELDAQIGENIMEKHMDLDDFSEDEDF
ncbi:uncharacterized protein LOC106711555 [Papilio machaon]|uniref:uncharacterized protein LOC106711555 n=1 Tax=Papilio machaon TaxID=76193 RepID=UPI001E664411|nr:uncharacterized protein LOC106711555 [Papilio machaon]